MNKHYIRINDDNYVVKGFSDAFETPLEADILINENGSRHFSLFNETNPVLFDEMGAHRYAYNSGVVYMVNEADIATQHISIENSAGYIRGLRDEGFTKVDKYQLTLVYSTLTQSEKDQLSEYRQAWLDAPDSKVIPTEPSFMN